MKNIVKFVDEKNLTKEVIGESVENIVAKIKEDGKVVDAYTYMKAVELFTKQMLSALKDDAKGEVIEHELTNAHGMKLTLSKVADKWDFNDDPKLAEIVQKMSKLSIDKKQREDLLKQVAEMDGEYKENDEVVKPATKTESEEKTLSVTIP